MRAGKLPAGIAGTAGAGSMGVLAEAVARFAAARAVPVAMWAVMAALMAVTAAVTRLRPAAESSFQSPPAHKRTVPE